MVQEEHIVPIIVLSVLEGDILREAVSVEDQVWLVAVLCVGGLVWESQSAFIVVVPVGKNMQNVPDAKDRWEILNYVLLVQEKGT